MAIVNGSFELGLAGVPDDWTVVVVSGTYDICDFSDSGLGAETFEDWNGQEGFIFAFENAGLAAATFPTAGPPTTAETFEYGWSANHTYLFAWGASEAAVFNALSMDPIAAETFEWGWEGNEDYLFAFDELADLATAFVETFEEDWDNNQDYAFSMPATSAATFGPSLDTFEDFENVKPPLAFTVEPATDVVTTPTAHGYSNLDKCTVEKPGGGVFPDGLQPETIYRVLSTTTYTLKLSLDGVTAIDIKTMGTGVHYLVADKTIYWTKILDF
jgi:hypothetical protein